MFTASKTWAIISGFVIVAGVILARIVFEQARPPAETRSAPLVSPPSIVAPSRSTRPQSTELGVPPAPAAPAATAALTPSEPEGPTLQKASAETPHFDVVRVEPNGDAVLAGQGVPNSTVDLVASGIVVAQAPTDQGGHFVMIPPALKPGDYALSLRQPVEGKAPSSSAQSVTVSLPEKGHGPVVVALAEPGQPTKLMSAPPVMSSSSVAAKTEQGSKAAPAPAVSPAAKTAAQALVIRSVELENGNGFFASGMAAPVTHLRIYLNNSPLAEVVAGLDSAWSIKIRKGLTGGHYVVRADAASGTAEVASRVEVPFDVPTTLAAIPAAPRAVAPTSGLSRPEPTASAAVSTSSVPSSPAVPAASPKLSPSIPPASAVQTAEGVAPAPAVTMVEATSNQGAPTDAVIDEIKTAVVRTGDNLWDISRSRLGQGWRYTRIYAANSSQIRNPSLIYPGQVFVLPTQNN